LQINELKEAINSSPLDFIERERTSKGIIDLGIFLYASGLSFRKTAYVLSQIEEEITHVSVWKWVQKHGSGLRARLYLDIGNIFIGMVIGRIFRKLLITTKVFGTLLYTTFLIDPGG